MSIQHCTNEIIENKNLDPFIKLIKSFHLLESVPSLRHSLIHIIYNASCVKQLQVHLNSLINTCVLNANKLNTLDLMLMLLEECKSALHSAMISKVIWMHVNSIIFESDGSMNAKLYAMNSTKNGNDDETRSSSAKVADTLDALNRILKALKSHYDIDPFTLQFTRHSSRVDSIWQSFEIDDIVGLTLCQIAHVQLTMNLKVVYLECIQSFAEVHSDEHYIHLLLGRIHASAQNYTMAIQCVEKAMCLVASPRLLAKIWNRMGLCVFESGKRQSSIICFMESLRIDDELNAAVGNLAVVYLDLGLMTAHDLCLDHLVKKSSALVGNSDDDGLLKSEKMNLNSSRSQSYMLQRQYEKQILFAKGIEDDVSVVHDTVFAMISLEQFQEALNLARANCGPQDYICAIYIGECLIQTRQDGAMHVYEHAIKLVEAKKIKSLIEVGNGSGTKDDFTDLRRIHARALNGKSISAIMNGDIKKALSASEDAMLLVEGKVC